MPTKTKKKPPVRVAKDHWVPLAPSVMKLADVQLDPSNARQHPQKNLDAIKGSLQQFGQQKPIVVCAQGVCIAGNGTVLAARELGWTEINVVRTRLTGEQARAYAIADNRTGELAAWDYEALAKSLEELKTSGADLALLGFEAHEIDTLLAAEWTPPPEESLDEHENLHRVGFTSEQWATIAEAIKTLEEKDLSDAEAVTKLCARACE